MTVFNDFLKSVNDFFNNISATFVQYLPKLNFYAVYSVSLFLLWLATLIFLFFKGKCEKLKKFNFGFAFFYLLIAVALGFVGYCEYDDYHKYFKCFLSVIITPSVFFVALIALYATISYFINLLSEQSAVFECALSAEKLVRVREVPILPSRAKRALKEIHVKLEKGSHKAFANDHAVNFNYVLNQIERLSEKITNPTDKSEIMQAREDILDLSCLKQSANKKRVLSDAFMTVVKLNTKYNG